MKNKAEEFCISCFEKQDHVFVLCKKHDSTMPDRFGPCEECKLKYQEEKREG